MNKLTALIVDDHEIFRNGLEMALTKTGLIKIAGHASHGQEAIELLEKKPVDLVFLDIHLPVMDGIKAAEIIRKKFPEVKIIAISIMENHASIAKMFRAGAIAYLLKSTHPEELKEAVMAAKEGKRFYTKDVSAILIENIIAPGKYLKPAHFVQPTLTEREKEIMRLICQQFSSKEISEILNITEKTVNNFRTVLLDKTGSKNVAGLVLFAIDHKIITPV